MSCCAGVEDEVEAIARELRKLILEVDPDAVEVIRLGDRAATYGVGPLKMSEGYAYIIPQCRHVNLGFYRGTSPGNPNGLLGGTGKTMRHVKVRTLDDARRAPVRDHLVTARDERWRALA